MADLVDWFVEVGEIPPVEFTFSGKAQSKERPRTGKNGHMYTPTKTREYEKMVADLGKAAIPKPMFCPVRVEVIITEEPPKSMKAATKELALAGAVFPSRGDIDNKVKAITDALNGIMYLDDVQINQLYVERSYGSENSVTVRCKAIGFNTRQIAEAEAAIKGQSNVGRNTRRRA